MLARFAKNSLVKRNAKMFGGAHVGIESKIIRSTLTTPKSTLIPQKLHYSSQTCTFQRSSRTAITIATTTMITTTSTTMTTTMIMVFLTT